MAAYVNLHAGVGKPLWEITVGEYSVWFKVRGTFTSSSNFQSAMLVTRKPVNQIDEQLCRELSDQPGFIQLLQCRSVLPSFSPISECSRKPERTSSMQSGSYSACRSFTLLFSPFCQLSFAGHCTKHGIHWNDPSTSTTGTITTPRWPYSAPAWHLMPC